MTGIVDKAKGAVKEAVGNATGDKDLSADGKLDQAKGHVKDAAENLKDQARRTVADVKDAVAERVNKKADDAERRTEPTPQR